MSSMTKRISRAGAVAPGMTTLAPLAASAGERRVNAQRCPDLREDL